MNGPISWETHQNIPGAGRDYTQARAIGYGAPVASYTRPKYEWKQAPTSTMGTAAGGIGPWWIPPAPSVNVEKVEDKDSKTSMEDILNAAKKHAEEDKHRELISKLMEFKKEQDQKLKAKTPLEETMEKWYNLCEKRMWPRLQCAPAPDDQIKALQDIAKKITEGDWSKIETPRNREVEVMLDILAQNYAGQARSPHDQNLKGILEKITQMLEAGRGKSENMNVNMTNQQ